MADLLYIANAALDLVGNATITSLDDGSPSAKKAKLHIVQAVREVLALGAWKSAKKQAVLAQLTDAPLFGWTYAYQLPNDYVGMILFNNTNPKNQLRPIYDIQGKVLLTDESTASLEYVCDLTMPGNDISAASAPMTELMAIKLAQKLAWGFQQARTLKESLEQEYQLKRRVALAKDAKETRDVLPNPAAESSWLRDRHISTSG